MFERLVGIDTSDVPRHSKQRCPRSSQGEMPENEPAGIVDALEAGGRDFCETTSEGYPQQLRVLSGTCSYAIATVAVRIPPA